MLDAAPPQPAQPEVTVCVFAWNERETTAAVVREVRDVLESLRTGYEIVVIDDGSTDGTAEIADRLATELSGVRVVHHTPNGGLGTVYRTGFTEAKGTFLTFFPGDGQFPATIIADFLPRARDKDLILGYLPKRTDVVGLALSTVERVLYGALLGTMPKFQGIFMVRTAALRALTLKSEGRGWGIVMEMILRCHRKGLRIESLPTGWRPRTHGVSKVNNWRGITSNVKQLVALRKLLQD